jgi:hypothetical protein
LSITVLTGPPNDKFATNFLILAGPPLNVSRLLIIANIPAEIVKLEPLPLHPNTLTPLSLIPFAAP